MRLAVVLAAMVIPYAVEGGQKIQTSISEIKMSALTGYSKAQYELTIRNDGTVEYQGENYVKEKGRRRSRISAEDFKRIIRKIDEVDFLALKDRYRSVELGGEQIFKTDQPTLTISVIKNGRTKSVEDYLGAPKRLKELEELIYATTGLSAWIGSEADLRDIPYYDSFPLNRRLKFRALLEHYQTSGDSRRISGYLLMFLKNSMSFDLQAPNTIDLSQFDGYIVDATGYIQQKRKLEFTFHLTQIRPVGRYVDRQPSSNNCELCGK
jgi:hypothetical protein